MCIQGTAVYPFRTLGTALDIVFHAVSNYGYNPERSLLKIHVLRICSYLEPQEVPRHDFECIRRDISQLKREDISQGL